MKFKTASILGLIIPVSMALMLTAFLGCGGGGAYGSGTQAYDGTWALNLKGYTKPTFVAPDTSMDCYEGITLIDIAHGFGTVTETIHCAGNVTASEALYGYPKIIDIGVTLTPDATGTTGTVALENTGGGPSPSSGVCIDRVTCTAGTSGNGLSMFKCGTVAAASSGC